MTMPSTDNIRPFRKVLVANRGEIARRVLRTLHRMGIASVGVFSDADADADADAASPHVEEADEAVRLGAAPSAASYLNHDAILDAARRLNVDAIHPGYGFLSENAEFAERCADAGVVFIGPAPQTLRQMGDKAAAKEVARRLGVATLDGFALKGLAADDIAQRAADLGFPLLVKAVAGGGGKGMRRVDVATDLPDALTAAARQAESAFGDGALLVERCLVAPRHLEVQILGDAHGSVVHCFERECSVQRRHQKVFEEAPSPVVDDALRQRLGDAAVTLCREVNYLGAGTVEFLLDGEGNFFFLEMNTRLQVEHPVTEAVTGVDMVRCQVEIAQGLPLAFEQGDLELTGHAIEARLYAEDPDHDFLPSTGTVSLWQPMSLWQPPASSSEGLGGLRIDSGIETGSEVGVYYDPLLAKIIAHGRHRQDAVRLLHRGLSQLAVGGLTTNREFLLAVLETEAFRRGEIDTSFIERHMPPAVRRRKLEPEVLRQAAIAATLWRLLARQGEPGPLPASLPINWRNNRWRPQEQAFDLGEEQRLTVHYVPSRTVDNTFEVKVEGLSSVDGLSTVTWVSHQEQRLSVELDGVRQSFRIAQASPDVPMQVHGLGRVVELRPVGRFPEAQASVQAGGCVAPMTGLVTQVLVAEGDQVVAGKPMVILEAMKMEHRLVAQNDGVVRSVRVQEGDMVDPDVVLVVVEPQEL